MDYVYKSLLLIEETVLTLKGQGLSQYSLPQPEKSRGILEDKDYLRETNYDTNVLAEMVLNNESLLTDEQFAL